jgi:hypothetical protein
MARRDQRGRRHFRDCTQLTDIRWAAEIDANDPDRARRHRILQRLWLISTVRLSVYSRAGVAMVARSGRLAINQGGM